MSENGKAPLIHLKNAARMSRDGSSQMIRWFAVLQLLQRDQFTSKSELAAQVQLSERQIERILRQLEDLGFPLCHERGRGYRVLKNGHSLPVRLTSEEIWALTVLQKSGLRGLGQGVHNALESLNKKIHSKLSPETLATLGDMQSLSAGDAKPAEDQVQPQVWQVITEGLTRGLQIRFDYHKLNSPPTPERQLEPWGLFISGGNWYLQGYDLQREAKRNFRLSRITQPRLTQLKATRPSDYDLSQNVFHRFDIGPEPAQTVYLYCQPSLDNWLRENPLHPSQTWNDNCWQLQIRNVGRLLDVLLSVNGLIRISPDHLHQDLIERAQRRITNWTTPNASAT
jgi:predicted DNA-binding transcriptional regulator YafY